MIQRVHFIEYNAKINTLAARPIFPKYGTPLLAAILKERGYDARIFLEGVSDMRFEKMADCDLVCFPVFAPAMNKVRACARQFRQERPRVPIVMGGPHVCLFPDSVVDVCDYAVRCEGDEVLPELIERLSNGGDARQVKGLSFLDGSQIVHTPDRPPPAIPQTIPDLTLIEGFERATRGIGRRTVVNTLQTSRGCHFHCKFCPTARLFGGAYRTRDIDSVVRDVRAKVRYNPFIFVVDNSFLGHRKRAAEMLHRLAKERLGAHFIIFERHEIGLDADMLQLMKRAGVRCIIVGIESLADENLQLYDKRQASREVVQAVENILAHGIHVIGTFVLGGDADTKDRAPEVNRFVEATGVSLNLFIVHDEETDESKGLMIPLNRRFQTYYERTDRANTDFYDYLTGNFVTYFPKRMKPSTLQECILSIYERAFSHPNIMRRVWSPNLFNATFGIAHGYAMKRMTNAVRRLADAHYLNHLRRVEQGLYDENEQLIEKNLASLDRLPIPRPLRDQVDFRSYECLVPLLTMPALIRYGLIRLRKRWGGGHQP